MGLDDFERELAARKAAESKNRIGRDRDEERDHRSRHPRHRDRSHHRDRSSARGDEKSRHSRKRDRHRDKNDEGDHRHRKRRRSVSVHRHRRSPKKEVQVFDHDDDDAEEEWVEKESMTAPPEEDILDQRDQESKLSQPERDAWMKEPSALDVEYVHSRKPKQPEGHFVSAKANGNEPQKQGSHVQDHAADLERDFNSEDDDSVRERVANKPAQHEVSYTFGDNGSSWRMTKLKAVYRQAKETGRPTDDVALERYGDLREFDDAREEERELDRRKVYGREYVGLDKPSGELYQERKMAAAVRRVSVEATASSSTHNDQEVDQSKTSTTTLPLDSTALNKLKAEMLKARMRNSSNAAALEEQYNLASQAAAANSVQSDVIVINRMENRQLAGDRSGEVRRITTKRGLDRGLVEENEDMSIEDMVRQEKRSRGIAGGEGQAFAERIAKDTKFTDDLEYMDENATKLSKRVIKTDVNLRNMAISDFQKMQRVLDSCPLCSHEDVGKPPVAPVVSLATRTYLTLPTEPEVAKGGAIIVPIQHRLNLLECDDDEWEEMRNFMKSLTRYYHSMDKSVVFYENAAFSGSRKGHAALNAVPLPHHLADNGPAYFREAILATDEQWTQHKPIIDTMALSQKPGYGRQAFRKSIAKEMPYFHIFFTLDGGIGHVIEDEQRWPKGDLFAREVLGGMLDRGPEVVKKQGRWERGDQRRIEGFRKKWAKFDWTAALVNASPVPN